MIKRKGKIKRATYTPEFKQEVVRQVLSGQSCSSTARLFGMPTQTIDNWLRQHENNLLKVNVLSNENNNFSSVEKIQLSKLRSEMLT